MTATTYKAERFATKSVVFYSVLVLSTLPLWMTPYLPMVDLPQHAGQITALREFLNGNPMFVDEFTINWFTPYLLGYLLLYALSSVFSIAMSTKLLVAAAVVGLPMATRRMLDYCGGDKDLAYLVIPASYGVAFSWGFLSFFVAAPLGILFFILAVSYSRDPTWLKAVSIVLFSILLFFSHLLVLVLISAISGVYILVTHYRDIRRLIIGLLPFAAPVPLALFWFLIIKDTDTAVREAAPIYVDIVPHTIGLLTRHTGLIGLGNLAGFVMTAATFGYPLMAGYKWSKRPERWLPFVLVIAAYYLVPWGALGSVFLSERFGIFLAAFWFLAWERPEHVRTRVMLVPATALTAFLAVNVIVFNDFRKESIDYNAVASQMEPGQRVLQIPLISHGPGFADPVYAHFVSWYQAETAGIVDFNFGYFYPMMLHYRDGHGMTVNNRFTWAPLSFRWESHHGDRYDYFIARFPVDASADIFKSAAYKVELVDHQGHWWLYERRGRDGAEAGGSKEP